MNWPLRDKLHFRLRALLTGVIPGQWRRLYWSGLGMRIGAGTVVPRMDVTWPHQVAIGRDCRIEPGVAFKFDGPWRPGPSILIGDRVFLGRDCEFNIQGRIEVGADTLVGSGCRFIGHDHVFAADRPIAAQRAEVRDITLGSDVWLGANVMVLRGVHIGDGAVVGAGAVVTKNVPAGKIWAGVPAREIGARFKEQTT